MPASEMPYLKEFSKSCPNAYEIYNQGICLPSSTLNEEEDIRKAALVIRTRLIIKIIIHIFYNFLINVQTKFSIIFCLEVENV